MTFREMCQDLENRLTSSYEDGVSIEDAERLAARFLVAQIAVSKELKNHDLDARTRKSGLKAIRAAVYLEIVQESVAGSGKKPTVDHVAALVDVHAIVQQEQNALDTAEVDRADLERYFDIFTNSHIYFRGISKGNFHG